MTARARHKKIIKQGRRLLRPPQERFPRRRPRRGEGGRTPIGTVASGSGTSARLDPALNAASRELGLTYARFMSGLTKAGVAVDARCSPLSRVREPEAFKTLVREGARRPVKDSPARDGCRHYGKPHPRRQAAFTLTGRHCHARQRSIWARWGKRCWPRSRPPRRKRRLRPCVSARSAKKGEVSERMKGLQGLDPEARRAAAPS